MISVKEALDTVRRAGPPACTEDLRLVDGLGRVLAEDVTSPEASPRYPNSALDGFAVRWQDVMTASESEPAFAELIGESRAGEPFLATVHLGEGVRISTGAMVPEGADTVVPIENAKDEGTFVSITDAPTAGQHVREWGEEFRPGELTLPRSTVLQPPQIALLASMGITSVPVFARPRVTIIITGTELVGHDAPAEPWQIRDSNGPMLAAAVRQSGGVLAGLDRAEDDLDATTRSIDDAAGRSDVLLVSGGVSVGPHDHVKDAAVKAGFETLLWKVRQKPGKPLFVAKRDGAMLFGLPGNPVSAFVCYAYYVHPLLSHLQGLGFSSRTVQGALAEDAGNTSERAAFLQVRTERGNGGVPEVHVLERQSSYMLSSVSTSDGLVLIEPGETLARGALVDVHLFPWVV